jgi:hypothetical protein
VKVKLPKPNKKKPLHQPIPELVKALAMPEQKRRKGKNVHRNPSSLVGGMH